MMAGRGWLMACLLPVMLMVTARAAEAPVAPVSPELPGGACQQKETEILHQIEYARRHGNAWRIAGLRSALDEVKRHCTDGELQKARQEKVEEKRRKVDAARKSLQEARASGRPDRVEKKQRKLARAQAELASAQER